MKPRKCIYLSHQSDNVGTALDTLHKGEKVPVLTSSGKNLSDIVIQAETPQYFKVAVKSIAEGEAIIKLGHKIGVAIARCYVRQQPLQQSLPETYEINPGVPVHLGNFVPSLALLRAHEFDIARTFDIIACKYHAGQSRFSPYECGFLKKTIGLHQEIFLRDLDLDGRVRRDLFPLDENQALGIALTPIGKGSLLRLGICWSETDYRYPGNVRMISAIEKFYKLLKGNIYEIG